MSTLASYPSAAYPEARRTGVWKAISNITVMPMPHSSSRRCYIRAIWSSQEVGSSPRGVGALNDGLQLADILLSGTVSPRPASRLSSTRRAERRVCRRWAGLPAKAPDPCRVLLDP